MDPHSGRIYDLEKDDIPNDVRKRLVPVDEAVFVKQQAEELGEILEEMERVISLDDPQPGEKFYPTNRAARRRSERLERKQKPKFVNKPEKVRDNG